MIHYAFLLFRYTSSWIKKAFMILTVYFIVINLFFYFINRDKIKYSNINSNQQIRQEIYEILDNPEFNSSTEGKLRTALFRGTVCVISGEACTENPLDGQTNFQHSMSGFMSNLLITPYMNPAASGGYWVQTTLANAGFIPNAYAAEGVGFSALKPFNDLWKVFRNVSYLLLVLVVITIGFMIMFRAKVDPQTVISMENALPRIVTAMILITFSFPIAGFLIDLMYVVLGLGISILSEVHPNQTKDALIQNYFTANMGTILDGMFVSEGTGTWYSRIPIIGALMDLTKIGGALVSLFPSYINGAIRAYSLLIFINPWWGSGNKILEFLGISNISKILNNVTIFGNTAGESPEGPLHFLLTLLIYGILLPFIIFYGAGFIVGIIIFLTMLFLWFRIFFMLFFGYMRILIMVIFSPIILMLDAIPGQNFFTSWIKNLAGELLMFPIVAFLLIVGQILSTLTIESSSGIWQPPFIWGIRPEAFSVLLGMGIIFMIPDLVKAFKELIGVKGLPLQFGLGTYFGGAAALGGGAMAGVGTFSSISMALPGLRGELARILPFGERFQNFIGVPESYRKHQESGTKSEDEAQA